MHLAHIVVSDNAGHREIAACARRKTCARRKIWTSSKAAEPGGVGNRCEAGAADQVAHAAWRVRRVASQREKDLRNSRGAIGHIVCFALTHGYVGRAAKFDDET